MKPSELKKFIRTSSGKLLNTDFIVCIQNYYDNYWFTMVDGINYEVDRNEETEFLVEYKATKYTQHLNAEIVINLITNAYKEFYIEKYT